MTIKPANINCSQTEWEAAEAAAVVVAAAQGRTLVPGSNAAIKETYSLLVNEGTIDPPQSVLNEFDDFGSKARNEIIKISPEGSAAHIENIRAKDEPPAPGSPQEEQEVINRLKGTGEINPQAKHFQIGNRKLSTNVPTDPAEFKKWKSQKDKGLTEAQSVLPRTERVRATTSGQPAEGQRTVAAAEASEAARVAARIAALSPRERTAFDDTIAQQEATAQTAAVEVAKKEEQREADRQALEMLKNQKEAELTQYKTAYFASPQVGIYIGDRWLGNAITIEFTENVSKSPLYGYASTHFDAVAKGNVIIQGQFSIAYTGENYLPAILDRYRKGEGVGDSVPFLLKDPIERAKKLFWNLENVDEPVKTLPLQYGYSGGKTGMVGDGFNIRIFYGSQKFLLDSFGTGSGNLKFEGPVQTIVNIHLTSRSFIVQPTGDPIGESYTFFARSITTGVSRQSINPNKVLRSRQGQTNISTTSGTTPTNVRNEPNSGNP